MHLDALFIGLALLVVTVTAFATVDEKRIDLLTFFLGRWALLISMYALSPFGYLQIRPYTWLVVGVSLATFAAFYVLALNARPSWAPHRAALAVNAYERARWPMFAWVVGTLFLAGSGLFTVYALNVVSTFGFSELLLSPHNLRISIAAGNIPFGFHYFYLLEMVPPLAIAGILFLKLRQEQEVALKFMTAASILLLLGTTGRVNATKAIVWALLVYLYGRPRTGTTRRGSLNLVKIAAATFLVLALFTVLGNLLGKTYSNSVLASSGIVSLHVHIEGLALPWHYNAAPLPTLDALLHDPNLATTNGGLTFLPIVKVAEVLFPSIDAPSHIGDYYRVPHPFNVATQIDTMYKDGRWIGVIASSAALGLVSGVTSALRRSRPQSAQIVLVYSLVALVLFASASNAAYIKPSYWLQAIMVLALGRQLDKHRRPSPVPPTRLANEGATFVDATRR